MWVLRPYDSLAWDNYSFISVRGTAGEAFGDDRDMLSAFQTRALGRMMALLVTLVNCTQLDKNTFFAGMGGTFPLHFFTSQIPCMVRQHRYLRSLKTLLKT